MLYTRFPESTFPYLSQYPLPSHFLKNRESKEANDHTPVAKMKAKKKSMPTITLSFTLAFCAPLLYLLSKLKIFQPEDCLAVNLHIISIV